MPKEISVFLDKHGNTAKLTECGTISVFARNKEEWHLVSEKDFTLKDIAAMKDLRTKMEELLDLLGDCKIFVGSEITGIPYFLLDKAKCSIWECKGKPFEFLDHILQKEEEALAQKPQPMNKPSFEELSIGYYRVNLKDIQENSTQLTTKQVLLPFLRKGEFNTLDIICNHVPRWLEGEALAGAFTIQTSELEKNKIKVTLSKPTQIHAIN